MALLETPRQRGAIKRAALDAGFTERGRFSRDYREIFGISPSIALSTSGRVEASEIARI